MYMRMISGKWKLWGSAVETSEGRNKAFSLPEHLRMSEYRESPFMEAGLSFLLRNREDLSCEPAKILRHLPLLHALSQVSIFFFWHGNTWSKHLRERHISSSILGEADHLSYPKKWEMEISQRQRQAPNLIMTSLWGSGFVSHMWPWAFWHFVASHLEKTPLNFISRANLWLPLRRKVHFCKSYGEGCWRKI